MRTITRRAKFTHANGRIGEIAAEVVQVTDEEFKQYIDDAVRDAKAAMSSIEKQRGLEPYAFRHPHLGPIGFFYGDKNRGLAHFIGERQEAHERTPSCNPVVEVALTKFAEAVILGVPVQPMPGSPRGGTPRISLIHQTQQVIIEPFWVNRTGTLQLPTHIQSAWVITSYQMEVVRQADMARWMQNKLSEVVIRRTVVTK